jgi:hypothetical protein
MSEPFDLVARRITRLGCHACGRISGYLNVVSMCGMKEAMRLSFLTQNGFNIEAMWG